MSEGHNEEAVSAMEVLRRQQLANMGIPEELWDDMPGAARHLIDKAKVGDLAAARIVLAMTPHDAWAKTWNDLLAKLEAEATGGDASSADLLAFIRAGCPHCWPPKPEGE